MLKTGLLRSGTVLFILGALLLPVYGQGPSFKPDFTFGGTSLADWHTLPGATWSAQQGEIIGEANQQGGGWLVLDKSFANVAFYAEVSCNAGCRAGVLLRATKTSDGGTSGVYVSLTEGDMGSYLVKLDPKGTEISRHKLSSAGGILDGREGGLPSIMGNSPPEIVNRARQTINLAPPPSRKDLPFFEQPRFAYVPGDWNQLGLILYGDVLKTSLNGTPFGGPQTLPNSVVPEGGYGPIALYVGGTGKAKFRNLSYKDLTVRRIPAEQVSPNFEMRRLDSYFTSFGTAVADVNRDGNPDVIAGPYYFLGPDFTTAHEIYTPQIYNPARDYPQASFLDLSYDFTGDGWPDVLVISGNVIGTGNLYVNPRGESRHWDHYVVLKPIGNEETLLADVDGDGRPEIIHGYNGALALSAPNPKNPTSTWVTQIISEPGPWAGGHGLGVGDINGDNRIDVITPYGWFEQPSSATKKTWTYHSEAFGRASYSVAGEIGGAQIGVYDVNGDGLNDIVTSLEAHGFGLAWYEQTKDASGKRSFARHMIMDNFMTENAGDVVFTQPHGTAFADINGDGILDVITGKRLMSHLFTYNDPDPLGAPVLYVYEVRRDKRVAGGAEFVPELVHNFSGVNSHFEVTDLNGDGMPDIATSGAFGTFVFFNKHKTRPAPASTL